MSHVHMRQEFPKGVLYGAGALIAFSMGLALLGRLTGFGAVHLPEAAVADAVEVRFEDRGAEGVAVREAATGTLITLVPSGEDGFIRGVVRSLARVRKLEGLESDASYRLTKWSDGRLSLLDVGTGSSIELLGFGTTNQLAFEKLLVAARR